MTKRPGKAEATGIGRKGNGRGMGEFGASCDKRRGFERRRREEIGFELK